MTQAVTLFGEIIKVRRQTLTCSDRTGNIQASKKHQLVDVTRLETNFHLICCQLFMLGIFYSNVFHTPTHTHARTHTHTHTPQYTLFYMVTHGPNIERHVFFVFHLSMTFRLVFTLLLTHAPAYRTYYNSIIWVRYFSIKHHFMFSTRGQLVHYVIITTQPIMEYSNNRYYVH